MFVDTHTHLYAKQFDKDRPEAMERCREVGVDHLYLPNIDRESIDVMMEMEGRYPGQCSAMMGLHPCSVNKDFEKELYEVESWLARRDFVAVGEIGTDLYWDDQFFEQQKEALQIQVGWAKQYKLPIVIHCRESFRETIEILEPLKDESLRGVFHCFTGSLEEAQEAIALGFYLGIGGVSTFKKGGLDRVIPEVSLDHLLLETDSPYLAPVPYRGKRNESSYIPIIAQRVSDLSGSPLEEVGKITSANARELFRRLA